MIKRSIPLSIQVYQELLREIQSGDLARKDGLLPSETDLTQRYNVSRATVREALYKLEQQGIIYRRHGSGTYLNRVPRVFETNLGEMEGLDALAQREGLDIQCKDVKILHRQPTENELKTFDLLTFKDVLEYSRLVYVGGQKVAFLRDVIPDSIMTQDDIPQPSPCSIWDTLKQVGDPPLSHSLTDIVVEPAPENIAKKLKQSKEAPLFTLIARNINLDGVIMASATSYFIPGTFKFSLVRSIRKEF